MILTLHTKYCNDIDSTYNLEMILALHTQYSADIGYYTKCIEIRLTLHTI